MELGVDLASHFIRTSLFFDEEWYRKKYHIPESEDAAVHYLKYAAIKGYNPSPNFSSIKYMQKNKDYKRIGNNPLLHFELGGRQRGGCWDFSMEDLRASHPELLSDMTDGLVRIRITNACNCKCRYCGVRKFFGDKKYDVMSKDWLFDMMKPLYEKIQMVLLTGGDPYILSHSYEYMKFLSDNYPHITIFTESNGIAFNEKFRELAADNLFKAHFSINASTRELFDGSCWEGTGGAKVYDKLMKNIKSYVELLKSKGLEMFSPDYSMVINHSNYRDVANFAKLALKLHASGIGFFFDYTENNMQEEYFRKPDFFRPALKTMMEIERVLKHKVGVGFRLWVPTKELGMMQPKVDAIPIEELIDKYRDIYELSEGRSIVREHEERNKIRKIKGKKELTIQEDLSPTIRMENRCGLERCFAPWKELDIYPDGRLDFCGWFKTPLINVQQAMSNGRVDWNELINSYEYMRERKAVLKGDYTLCMDCCPMNDATSPIIDLFKDII